MAPSKLKIDWWTMGLLVLQWLLFAGNFVLYAVHPLPIFWHVLATTVAIHLAFTIWHEAAHRTVANRGWLNNVVGVLGMFPYLTPYFMQRHIHLEHHKYLNEDRDPNALYAGGPFWQLPLRYLKAPGAAAEIMREDPRSPGMRLSDRLSTAIVLLVWGTAIATGHLLELVLLWAIPLAIAKVVMDWYVNYLPHVGLPPDRFLGTRIITAGWLTPLVLNHNYHAIHHLWPKIPWHRYREAFAAKRDYLDSHHVPIEPRLFMARTVPPPAPSATDLPSQNPEPAAADAG